MKQNCKVSLPKQPRRHQEQIKKRTGHAQRGTTQSSLVAPGSPPDGLKRLWGGPCAELRTRRSCARHLAVVASLAQPGLVRAGPGL